MAAGFPRVSGFAFHLVLQQSPVPALLTRLLQSAHGVRKETGFPRCHHLQPEPAAAPTHEEDGHIQRGEVAGTFWEELAGVTRSQRGSHPSAGGRRGDWRAALVATVSDFGL